MAKKEKKEKVAKKSASKVRGFVCALIAVVLFVGVGVCDALTTGKNMFSFVSTGSIMDRFDKASQETSKKETESFFKEATSLFTATAAKDQKYTSYTMTYTVTEEYADLGGKTYTNIWREVQASVDKDYTVVTVSERYAEALTYYRRVEEYVLCKTGDNAGKVWGRMGSSEQSVGDIELLDSASWKPLAGSMNNFVAGAWELLTQAIYGSYDVVDGKFNFSANSGAIYGDGTMKPGLAPTVSFSFLSGLEYERASHHVWTCSHLNATKAIVPQSLAKFLGGAV